MAVVPLLLRLGEAMAVVLLLLLLLLRLLRLLLLRRG
jgi:hypothetical protein